MTTPMVSKICLALVPAFVCGSQVCAECWLYVSLLHEKKIVAFERHPETGQLTRTAETACPAEPAFLSSSPDGRTLFVSFRSTGELASYHIDATSGKLTLLNVVEGGEDPAYLQTDNTGRFLLTAYYAANKVTVHRILDGGLLSSRPVQSIPTAQRAHGIAFSADNKTVLVPHTGANRIYSFRFNAASGLLTSASPAFLTTPTDNEPRHIMLHPSTRWAYTSDEKGDSVSMYSVNDGRLVLQQTVSSIPDDFSGEMNSTARCEITPDGRFVYVANRGHDSIAAFAIDQKTGRVRSLGRTPTEKTPRSFSIDSEGRFLYAAGQASGKTVVYAIQPDGHLKNVSTVDSGPVSWAVLAVNTR